MDILDDIIDIFRTKKSLFWIIVVIYIIVMTIILTVIWTPENKSYTFSKYEEADEEEYVEATIQTYLNNIALYFNQESKTNISNLISDEYLSYANVTRDDVINKLEKLGAFNEDVVLEANGLSSFGTDQIYQVKLKSDSKSIIDLNIIEKNPGEYKIALDNFYKKEVKNVTDTKYDINFNVTEVVHRNNSATYEMSIENVKNEYVSIGFGLPTSIYLKLTDGKMYYIVLNAESSSYRDISKGTKINTKIVFEIPLTLQESIKSINFKDVKIDGIERDISIEI